GPGCHHHLNPDRHGVGGLEVLCHAHHAEVTAAQAKERAAKRAANRPVPAKKVRTKSTRATKKLN
ncbi:MAG: hypothetical protein ACKOKA_04105, partial [Acidimicrobiaceae bacterium]